jgi:TP901 family phage tail tape measure protein
VSIALSTLLIHVRTDVNKAIADLTRLDAKVKGSSVVGGIAAKATGYAAAAAVGYSIKAFVDFDAAMNESLAIMGDVEAGMRDKLEKGAMAVAETTTFSAKQAAEAYYFLASSGYDAQASLKLMPVVAKFAQAGMFDMARATEFLADAQASLGLRTGDVEKDFKSMIRVSDVLTKANILSNATVEQFAEALTSKAGAALRLVGKDVEEGAAVLAAFAQQGTKGRLAGERLTIVLRDLQTAAIKKKGVFADFGIEVFDAAGEMRNMADIMKDLEDAMADMSDEEKRATFRMLGFQDRSVAALQQLMGMSGEIRRFESELRNAGGTTEEVAKKQLESFKNQLILGWHHVQNLAIRLGGWLVPRLFDLGRALKDVAGNIKDYLEEPLGQIIDIVQRVREAFVTLTGDDGAQGFGEQMDNLLGNSGRFVDFFRTLGNVILEVADFIDRNAGIIKAALIGMFSGAALSVVLAMAAAIGGPLIGAIGLLVGILTGPIALIGALAAALIYAYKNFEGFRKVVDGVGRFIRDELVPVLMGLADWLTGDGADAASGFGKAFMDTVGAVIAWITGTAVPAITGFVEAVAHEIDSIAQWLDQNVMPIFESVGDFIVAFVDRVIRVLKFFAPVLDFVKGIFRGAFEFIKRTVQTVIQAVEIVWKNFGDNLLRIISSAWTRIKQTVESVLRIIKGVIDLFTGILKGDWEKAWGAIQQIFSGAWSLILDTFQNMWALFWNAISLAIDAVITLWQVGWNTIKNYFSAVWSFIYNIGKGWLKSLLGLVMNGLNLVKNTFVSIWNSVFSWFAGNIRKITTPVSDAINTIISTVGSLAGKFLGLLGKIGSAAASIGNAIRNGIVNGLKGAVAGITSIAGQLKDAVWGGIKSLINTAVDGINDAIPNSIDIKIRGVGVSFNLPDNPVPKLHGGGRVTGGPIGSEVLRMLQVGETVFTDDQMTALGRVISRAQNTYGMDALRATVLNTANVARMPALVGAGDQGNVYIQELVIDAHTIEQLENSKQFFETIRQRTRAASSNPHSFSRTR